MLCLPASTWLSFIFSTVLLSEGQLQKISDLFFTESKISLYRTIAIVPLLIALVLFWKRKIYVEIISDYWASLISYVKHLWKVQVDILKNGKVLTLIGVLLVYPLGFIYQTVSHFPFTVDEAFSWVHLVNKGPLVSALYYPAPNNHIFYTIVCSLVNYLPLEPIWVMRVPTVVAYMLSTYVLFLIVSKTQQKKAAYMAAFFFLIHPSFIYYALHGRGYMFLVLFVLLSCWFLYSALMNKVKPAYAGFVICCVLGFYTIPVFLYYFILLAATAAVYVVWHKAWDRIRVLSIAFSCVALCTGFLYLPVLLLNGTDALFNNTWVQPQSFTFVQVYVYAYEVLCNLTTVKGWFLVIPLTLVSAVLILFYFENRSHRWLVVAMLFWLPVLVLVLATQHVLPFERIWVPLSVVWIFTVVWLMVWFEQKGYKILGIVLIMSMIFVSLLDRINSNKKGDPYYEQLHAFVDQLDPEYISSVYSGDDTYLVMLQVKFARAHKEATFTAIDDLHGQTADLRIIPRNAMDKEAISVDEELFYSNSSIVAYRRKGLQILR